MQLESHGAHALAFTFILYYSRCATQELAVSRLAQLLAYSIIFPTSLLTALLSSIYRTLYHPLSDTSNCIISIDAGLDGGIVLRHMP
jgi:hypothetical protein